MTELMPHICSPGFHPPGSGSPTSEENYDAGHGHDHVRFGDRDQPRWSHMETARFFIPSGVKRVSERFPLFFVQGTHSVLA